MKLEWMKYPWTFVGYIPMAHLLVAGRAKGPHRWHPQQAFQTLHFIPDIPGHQKTVYLWEGITKYRKMDDIYTSATISSTGEIFYADPVGGDAIGVVHGSVVDGIGSYLKKVNIDYDGNDYCWIVVRGGSTSNEESSRQALESMAER